jgi:hypothetical protein
MQEEIDSFPAGYFDKTALSQAGCKSTRQSARRFDHREHVAGVDASSADARGRGRLRTSGAASGLPGGGTSRPPDLGGVSMGWERTKSNPPPHRNRSSIDARPRCGAAVSPRVRPDGSARTDSPLLSQTVPEAHGGPASLSDADSGVGKVVECRASVGDARVVQLIDTPPEAVLADVPERRVPDICNRQAVSSRSGPIAPSPACLVGWTAS